METQRFLFPASRRGRRSSGGTKAQRLSTRDLTPETIRILCGQLRSRSRLVWVRRFAETMERVMIYRQERSLMPNEITALDAAMMLLFHVVAHWRGASEFFRST